MNRAHAAAMLRDTGRIYWELVRIIVPVMLVTQALMEMGVIAALAPFFAPLMGWYGLPAELALALLTGVLIGVWHAALLLFVLVPAEQLDVAQVTVFSALLLFMHALPVEQQIIRRAGPSLWLSTSLRVAGGLLFAALVHGVLQFTGWLQTPVSPAWQPVPDHAGWMGFFLGLIQMLAVIGVVLAALVWLMQALKISGLIARLHRVLAPVLRLAGIRGEALHLTAVGLLLGVSYGGGLLIREARTGHIAPQQVTLACVFMGFAHSVIEDSLIMIALGADAIVVVLCRVLFALVATALVAAVMARWPQQRARAP